PDHRAGREDGPEHPDRPVAGRPEVIGDDPGPGRREAGAARGLDGPDRDEHVNVSRPTMSLSLPASGSASTWPTAYAVMTQLVQLIVDRNPSWIACSAVATMVPSSVLISKASAT